MKQKFSIPAKLYLLLGAMLVLSTLSALASEPPARCRNVYAFQAQFITLGERNLNFFQQCVSYHNTLEALTIGIRSMEAGQFSAPTDDPGGQVGSLLSAANLAEAGATEQQKKARVYAAVHSHYQNIAVEATRREQELAEAKERARTNAPGIYSSQGARFDEAKNDFAKIRQESERGRALAEAKALELGVSAAQLNQLAIQSRDQVSGLFNGNRTGTSVAPGPQGLQQVANPGGTTTTSQGVSTNTMVALGGAALIAAGTVGGIAYFGNQAIDKADKKAQERIAQAEQTANRVIANAEPAYNRMMDRARAEMASFREELVKDFKAQMKGLSNEQLVKLNDESGKMFDAEIEKAEKNGDTNRAATLRANKKTFQDAIAEEQARRRG